VCYGFQLFDELPHDSHDIKVDGVITEKGIDTMI
jgi:5-formyltetrahydrofolate cyclo-ligase